MAACRYCGVKEENAHFQNLPFYETGTVKKKPHSYADVQLTYDLLNKIKPHQIFAAGDLSDPHGTHRVCLQVIFEAMDKLVKDGVEWVNDCYLWLYRGAWQEWDIADMEMAVPIGPKDMERKKNGIFKHQSQKDARKYNNLGMAEYEAMEGFVRYHFN